MWWCPSSSPDRAVHKDTIRRWKDFAPDIEVDWVRMAQNVLRYNVVIVGRFFNKGSWVSGAWKNEYPEEFKGVEEVPKESLQLQSQEKYCALTPFL